jgi:polyhydroxyalkanoate synthesis regulator phasin
MPKKQNLETQAEQSKRFKKTVADLVAAGDLNTAEAAEKMERMMKAGARKRPETSDSSNLD